MIALFFYKKNFWISNLPYKKNLKKMALIFFGQTNICQTVTKGEKKIKK